MDELSIVHFYFKESSVEQLARTLLTIVVDPLNLGGKISPSRMDYKKRIANKIIVEFTLARQDEDVFKGHHQMLTPAFIQILVVEIINSTASIRLFAFSPPQPPRQ